MVGSDFGKMVAMALGDGIRRNFATISDEERALFVAAIRVMDDPASGFVFPNNAGHEGADANGDITFWDMQEQIHKDAHVHGSNVHFGPGFIPWHRALCNHMEALLRRVDSRLSLHYWDWTTDPRVAPPGGVVLFTHQWMGDDGHEGINRIPADGGGDAGDPFADFETTEGGGHNFIWRNVGAQAANADGTPNLASDGNILGNGTFTSFAAALKAAHDDTAHSYIGGTIIEPHYPFHDPFVFLLHSNLDRLWAMWQRQPGHPDRVSPATAYGTIATDLGFPADYFDEWVQPWAGVDRTGTLQTDLNPWASDPSSREPVAYNDASIVTPPSYDTDVSATSLNVSCSPPSVVVGAQTACTATVSNLDPASSQTPSGPVTFSSSRPGTFTPAPSANLAGTAGSASCSVQFAPSASSAGAVSITGTYNGDANHLGSTGSSSLDVLTPSQALELVINQVGDLESNGVLNHGQANSLVVKLRHASDNLDASRNKRTACNQLSALVHEVNADVSAGILSPAQADTLLGGPTGVLAAMAAIPC